MPRDYVKVTGELVHYEYISKPVSQQRQMAKCPKCWTVLRIIGYQANGSRVRKGFFCKKCNAFLLPEGSKILKYKQEIKS